MCSRRISRTTSEGPARAVFESIYREIIAKTSGESFGGTVREIPE